MLTALLTKGRDMEYYCLHQTETRAGVVRGAVVEWHSNMTVGRCRPRQLKVAIT